MQTYKVLQNLNHDNTEYPIGSVVELDSATAGPLVEDGVVESTDKPEPTPRKVESSRLDKNKKEDASDDKDKKDEDADDDKDKDDGLEALTIPKLKKLAEEEEIELAKDLDKPGIVEAIRAARLEKKDEDAGDDL